MTTNNQRSRLGLFLAISMGLGGFAILRAIPTANSLVVVANAQGPLETTKTTPTSTPNQATPFQSPADPSLPLSVRVVPFTELDGALFRLGEYSGTWRL